MEPSNNVVKAKTHSLVARLATKFGVEPGRLLKCLTCQVFKQSDGVVPTNEEMMVLLLVCENYGLNPFNREIFAFRGKSGDIIPVVSLDGWARIVRSQKDFDGMSFSFSSNTVKVAGYPGELPEYIECSMRLKGIDSPIVIQEFTVECFNPNSSVWRKWPRRMLRTRSFIQCARLAFSLTGIYDEGAAFVEEEPQETSLRQTESLPVASTGVPKLTVDRVKLDAMLEKLAEQAKTHENGWKRALLWARTNLDDENRVYAEEFLRKKEFESAETTHRITDSDVPLEMIDAKEGVIREDPS